VQLAPPPAQVANWHRQEAAEADRRLQWFAALWHLDRLLEADPADAAARRSRAVILATRGELDLAAVEMQKANGAAQDDPPWRTLGLTLAKRGAWKEALACYDKGVPLRPDDAKLRADRARACVRLGQWARAAEDYGVLAAANPNDLDSAATFQAATLILANDREGYRRQCTALMDKHGQTKDEKRAYNVARICAMGDSGVDPARLVELAQRGVAKERKPWSLHTLGWAYYRAGQYEEAIAAQHESAIPSYDNPANWLVLALAHHRLGKSAEALRWLEKATAWLDQAGRELPAGAATPPKLHPNEWMLAQVLRREAEAEIRGKAK
jgi:tetratricopeptide (TPR) repeat protein